MKKGKFTLFDRVVLMMPLDADMSARARSKLGKSGTIIKISDTYDCYVKFDEGKEERSDALWFMEEHLKLLKCTKLFGLRKIVDLFHKAQKTKQCLVCGNSIRIQSDVFDVFVNVPGFRRQSIRCSNCGNVQALW